MEGYSHRSTPSWGRRRCQEVGCRTLATTSSPSPCSPRSYAKRSCISHCSISSHPQIHQSKFMVLRVQRGREKKQRKTHRKKLSNLPLVADMDDDSVWNVSGRNPVTIIEHLKSWNFVWYKKSEGRHVCVGLNSQSKFRL